MSDREIFQKNLMKYMESLPVNFMMRSANLICLKANSMQCHHYSFPRAEAYMHNPS